MPSKNLLSLRPASLVALVALAMTGCVSAPPKPAAPEDAIVFPKPPDPARFVYEQTLLGTGSTETLDDKDRLRQLLTGETTRSGIGFAKPFDVAVHQGRVYVTDTVLRAVVVLDFPAQRGFMFGDRGDDGDLYKPLGIAIDATGTVYVCDNTLRAIQIYDAEGNFLRRIEGKGNLERPSGIEITPDGSRLFVVDTGGVSSERHRVAVFDAKTGEHLRDIGRRGTGDGEMNLPRDVHLAGDGTLYVTDGGNFRVLAFSQTGEFLRAWGEPGRRLGQFSRPKGIAGDRDGNLYVVDAAFGNFQVFSPRGELLMFVGERSTTPDPAKYMLPAGIAVDEDGRVFMVEQYFRRVDVYRPVGMTAQDGWVGKGRLAANAP